MAGQYLTARNFWHGLAFQPRSRDSPRPRWSSRNPRAWFDDRDADDSRPLTALSAVAVKQRQQGRCERLGRINGLSHVKRNVAVLGVSPRRSERERRFKLIPVRLIGESPSHIAKLRRPDVSQQGARVAAPDEKRQLDS